jgi:hypothetical protein
MTAVRPSRLFLAALLALGACRHAFGQLADNSPFLPPGATDGGIAAGGGEPLELRGIMSTTDGLKFCIYDPARKSSAWVSLNEAGHDYVVRGSNPADDSVTLQSGGHTYTLALRTSKTAPLAGSAANMPSREAGGQVPGRSFTPVDEANRLEAIAAEVRRRRLQREQVDQAQQRAFQQQYGNRPQQ